MSAESPAKFTAVAGLAGTTRRRPVWLRQIGQLLIICALGFGSYYLISNFFVQSVSVVGRSMSPTLHDSERYLLNRWITRFRAPRRSEVIVLRDPLDTGYSVKRVIGVAGDTVTIQNGCVYLNGRVLAEPYLPEGLPTYAETRTRGETFRCGKNQSFVLGDNRPESMDSRAYGPISNGDILGVIVR